MKTQTWWNSWLMMLCIAAGQPAFAAVATNEVPKPASPSSKAVVRVGVDEFEKMSHDKKNVVLDVRTKKEFDNGHIPGALNLDVNAPDFEQKVAGLEKDKLYLVHCAAGVRSARACDKMSKLGFLHLVDLAPGFRGWEKAGKPVEK
jgi:rhodanese-related sulfurtransferase